MPKRVTPLCTAIALAFAIMLGAAPPAVAKETLVLFRHGEKPAGGYGQLTCQGLNRALKLPTVLVDKYGMPDALFAPDPSGQVSDPAGKFDYVRALATIEPTAVRLGMPIHADRAFTDIAGLESDLTRSDYADSLVFVAWEHVKLDKLVKKIVADYGGDPDVVPKWPNSDYDSLFVLTLDNNHGAKQVSFSRDDENLNGQSLNCPN